GQYPLAGGRRDGVLGDRIEGPRDGRDRHPGLARNIDDARHEIVFSRLDLPVPRCQLARASNLIDALAQAALPSFEMVKPFAVAVLGTGRLGETHVAALARLRDAGMAIEPALYGRNADKVAAL